MRAILTLRRRLAALRRDRRGVSAVEFALIAPVLILTFFGMAELSQALTAQRRISHAASAIGDLAAQSSSVTASGLTDIFSAASTIIAPFSTTPLRMRLTSITGDSSATPKVDWSSASGAGISALAKQSTVAGLPAGLITATGDNVIMAETTYSYASTFAFFLKNGLTFNQKFYLRPRKVNVVTCPDC